MLVLHFYRYVYKLHTFFTKFDHNLAVKDFSTYNKANLKWFKAFQGGFSFEPALISQALSTGLDCLKNMTRNMIVECY